MLKKIFLTIFVSAIMLSVYSDPILCTFEGTLTSLNGSAIDRGIIYSLILDFDDPGLYGGDLRDDYELPNGKGFYNRGSADIYDESELYFSYENMNYTSAYVEQYTGEFLGYEFNDDIVLFDGENPESARHYLSLYSTDDIVFDVGDYFSVIEKGKDYPTSAPNTVTGFVILTSKVPYTGEQAVPEPSLLTLMASGICMLSGFGFKRKNKG